MSRWAWAFAIGLASVAIALVVRGPSLAAATTGSPRPRPTHLPGAPKWQRAAARADAGFDVYKQRVLEKYGVDRPGYIAAYRGFADASGCEVMGRVLADAPPPLPDSRGSGWKNLREQWARFESDEVPGVTVDVTYAGRTQQVTTDAEGYYRARIPIPPPAERTLWRHAEVAISGTTLKASHEILAVSDEAQFGIVSDIDDTVLDSQIVNWKSSAKLTFLHNVRTRKPLLGVAQLYLSLQRGRSEVPINPLFYVSSSPWNLYDLLETFLSLNDIPPGPILLRDLGIEPGYFIKSRGHGHKLDNVRRLFAHYPKLKWILVGDSGQADAEIYSTAAREFPGRVLAIYIRDVDPETDSEFDRGVDGIISGVAGTPMLRVRDSDAIAQHARSIGLLPSSEVAAVRTDVARDEAAPPQVQTES